MLGSKFPCFDLSAPDNISTHDHAADAPAHADWARVDAHRDALETSEILSAQRPDWVLVDHYAFDHRWHAQVRQQLSCRIAVIDDLGDRKLAADLLIDHNPHPDHATKYRHGIPAGTACCFGPNYALLGPDYEDAPRYEFHDVVRSIGIFLGGTDPRQFNLIALAACREIAMFRGPIEIATTSANPTLKALEEAVAHTEDVILSVDQRNLAQFFARHDLQIGAGGGATWERCCIGAPTVGLVCAENQLHSMPYLHDLEALDMVRPLGDWSGVRAADVAQAVAGLIANPSRRRRLSDKSRTLVDGRGAFRVAARIKKFGDSPCLAD